MAGRVLNKGIRVYLDGYRMSGYTVNIGPLSTAFAENGLFAVTDAVKGYLPGNVDINPGTLNGIFDNTATSGLHAIASAAAQGGAARNLMVAIGTLGAAPAVGDPTFAGVWNQQAYVATPSIDSLVAASIKFSGYNEYSNPLTYISPAWGLLLHVDGAETAVNSSNTPNVDNAAASANGGVFYYQVFAGNGTATLSVDDSANATAWAGLSGATSGSIDCSSVKSGQVAIPLGSTVRRYIRWQLALGSATTVTFACAFARC
jgi:hypothetical protein